MEKEFITVYRKNKYDIIVNKNNIKQCLKIYKNKFLNYQEKFEYEIDGKLKECYYLPLKLDNTYELDGGVVINEFYFNKLIKILKDNLTFDNYILNKLNN